MGPRWNGNKSIWDWETSKNVVQMCLLKTDPIKSTYLEFSQTSEVTETAVDILPTLKSAEICPLHGAYLKEPKCYDIWWH